jgi:repressor LexA
MTDEMQREIFATNLRIQIAKSGKQQQEIAEALGFNRKTFSGWCNGLSIPTMGKVQTLADYFGILKSDLLDDHRGDQFKTESVRIPLMERVAAGQPIEASGEVIDFEEIPLALAKTGDFFSLKVVGNSMEPKISDGDTLIVRKQDSAENGDLVIVMVNGDDACVKRLRKLKDGIMLISSNPAYDPIIYTAQEVESLPVRIAGKVYELRSRFF